jgi:hypothetical protein
MRHRLSFLTPSPAMAVAFAALLAACTGLAVAAGSSGQVIHACANKKTGALRIANTSKCRHGELPVRWNLTGPQGARGPAGANGTNGATGQQGTEGLQGKEGPQGPGATSFSTTLPQGNSNATLITLGNGLKVGGTCTNGPANVAVVVETVGLTSTLQASGTGTNTGGVFMADANLEPVVGANDTKRVDLDVIARDSNIGKFVRIDVHGEFGVPCTYWGMVTPSN